MFIEFETDCWKCSEMHPEVASSPQELWDIVTGMGDWLPDIRIVAIENDEGERIEHPTAKSNPILLPIIETLRAAQEGSKKNV